MITRLGEKYGLEVIETPVGFDHIADWMLREDVLIGGEESGGISFKGHIPEGDGILIGLLVLGPKRLPDLARSLGFGELPGAAVINAALGRKPDPLLSEATGPAPRTPFNDRTESLAMKTSFGEHAKSLAISSTKSMTGHLLGAAGGLEAGITCLSIERGMIPPTINQENADPDCDLDYVPNQARARKVTFAMSTSLGFGGHNVVLLMGKDPVLR